MGAAAHAHQADRDAVLPLEAEVPDTHTHPDAHTYPHTYPDADAHPHTYPDADAHPDAAAWLLRRHHTQRS